MTNRNDLLAALDNAIEAEDVYKLFVASQRVSFDATRADLLALTQKNAVLAQNLTDALTEVAFVFASFTDDEWDAIKAELDD